MTIPILLFALLISLLCGTLFHILRGGSGWRLLLYFGLSVLGFAVGQWISICAWLAFADVWCAGYWHGPDRECGVFGRWVTG